MDIEAKRILEEGAQLLGIRLTARQRQQFQLYLLRLKKWNKRINLTAIRKDKEIVIKHFLDSLTLFSCLKPYFQALDIGSGAGFPGIPLKIVLPSLQLTLVEARHKRVAFLKEIKRLLGLTDLTIVNAFLTPEVPILPPASFDVVMTRALAPAAEYIPLALPYVKKGGYILLMQGRKREDVIELCQKYALTIHEEKDFMLPFSEIKRYVVVLKKLSN